MLGPQLIPIPGRLQRRRLFRRPGRRLLEALPEHSLEARVGRGELDCALQSCHRLRPPVGARLAQEVQCIAASPVSMHVARIERRGAVGAKVRRRVARGVVRGIARVVVVLAAVDCVAVARQRARLPLRAARTAY